MFTNIVHCSHELLTRRTHCVYVLRHLAQFLISKNCTGAFNVLEGNHQLMKKTVYGREYTHYCSPISDIYGKVKMMCQTGSDDP